MVNNYNVKDEEFSNLFGSQRRKLKKQLASTSAELEATKANQQVLQDTLTQQKIAAIQSGSGSSTPQPMDKKPNLLLLGGIALVVVIGGIMFINRK